MLIYSYDRPEKLLSENFQLFIDFIYFVDRPQTPKSFTVISVGDTSITIHWEPAEDGGFKQTFYIEYKVLSLTSWNRREMPILDQTDKGQTYDLTGLQSSNHYELRMYANNRINKSLPTGVITAQTTSIGKMQYFRQKIKQWVFIS